MKRIALCTLICGTALAVVSANGPVAPDGRHYLSQPLVTSIYTADPSAHVFHNKIYVYPSHAEPPLLVAGRKR